MSEIDNLTVQLALVQSQLALQMATALRQALAKISPQLDAEYLAQMETLQSAIDPESTFAKFQEALKVTVSDMQGTEDH